MRIASKAFVACIVASIVAGDCLAATFPQNRAGQDARIAEHRTRNVAIVVHEGVELLDFAGPGEVFAAAARRGSPPETPWFNVYTVAPSDGEIASQGYVRITPQYTIENCPKPDILVIPGGATGVLLDDSKFMDWVRDHADSREVTLSVCTGALVLARAGLLQGKSATTHWGSISDLKSFPDVTVLENVRFVDQGSIVTSAGVSAGIDGALHVVARLAGLAIAKHTARYMEYEWQPDARILNSYHEISPALKGRERGFALAELHRRGGNWPEAIKAFEALTKEYPEDAEAWYLLGYCVHAAGDLDRAIDLHTKAASFDVRRDRPLYNLACAWALKGEADKAFAALDEAIAAGWNNPGFLAQDADWNELRIDPRFAAALERLRASRTPR